MLSIITFLEQCAVHQSTNKHMKKQLTDLEEESNEESNKLDVIYYQTHSEYGHLPHRKS